MRAPPRTRVRATFLETVSQMSKQNKKILLLSVSAGAGHTRAAEAIRAFADHHPAGIEATHLDVMDFVSTGFRKLYTDLYIKLVSSQPAL